MGDIQNSYDYCQLYNHDYHDYRHVFLQIYDVISGFNPGHVIQIFSK